MTTSISRMNCPEKTRNEQGRSGFLGRVMNTPLLSTFFLFH